MDKQVLKSPLRIDLKSPLRIDFAGGYTDNLAVYYGIESYLSSVAINPHIELTEQGIRTIGSPQGSGLAESTAILFLKHLQASKRFLKEKPLDEIAKELWELELKGLDGLPHGLAYGIGDSYPLVLGGFNCFRCYGKEVELVKLNIKGETLDLLNDRLLLLSTNIPRKSLDLNDIVCENYESGELKYKTAVSTLSDCALKFAQALEAGNLDECGRLISKNWEAQKQLASQISSSEIDLIYDFAISHGALGGKLCGAGGGGYFVFYTHDRNELGRKLIERFPSCSIQPFQFEYKNIKELNS